MLLQRISPKKNLAKKRLHYRIATRLHKPKVKLWLTVGLFVAGLVLSMLVNRVPLGTGPWKDVAGCVAAGLSTAGLGYYIIDTLWGTNRPHLYSWLIWTVLDAVVWYSQWAHGAGPGAWSTLVMTVLSGVIFMIALYQYLRGQSDQPITIMDQGCLIGALLSLGLLVAAPAGAFSIVTATIVDVFGFVPTIKKAWRQPGSETPVNYSLNTVRHIIALFAIESYNLVTIIFPASLVLLNGLVVGAVLVGHRRQGQAGSGIMRR